MLTIEEILNDYEKKLKDAYARANTKSKKKKVAYDLFRFGMMNSDLFNIDKEYEWDYDFELYDMIEDYKLEFVKNTLSSNLFYKFSKSVINSYKNVKFPFYRDHGKVMRRLSEREMQEIIFDFANDYDVNLLKKFKDLYREGNVFEGELSGCSGLTFPLQSINKNLLFYTSDLGNSVYSASVIAHEYGHCYEYDSIYEVGSVRDENFINKLPFSEVSSKFFEYAFLRYLKENKIYETDTDICLRNYYINLFSFMYSVNLSYKMKNIVFDNFGNVTISDQDVIDYATKVAESVNYFDIPYEKGELFDYRNAYIYGLGGLFSVYLYDAYLNDKEYFKKEFRNALINYPKCDGISAFEKVGVTEDKLVRGDILRRVLKDSK